MVQLSISTVNHEKLSLALKIRSTEDNTNISLVENLNSNQYSVESNSKEVILRKNKSFNGGEIDVNRDHR